MKKFLSSLIIFVSVFFLSAQETDNIWNHYEGLKSRNQKSVRIVTNHCNNYLNYQRGNENLYTEYLQARNFLFARRSGFNALFQSVKDKNDRIFDLLYPAFSDEINGDEGYADTSEFKGYIFEYAFQKDYLHGLEAIQLDNLSYSSRKDNLLELAAKTNDNKKARIVFDKLLKNYSAGTICSKIINKDKKIIAGIKNKTIDINYQYPESDNRTLVNEWCRNYLDDPDTKKNLEYLIKNGADLNIADNHGSTPLINIVVTDRCKKIELLESFIKSGADAGFAELAYENNFSFIQYALKQNMDLKIISLLIDGGANLNPPGDYSGLIATAIYEHRYDIADLLIDKGADINAPGLSCYTPLSRACHDGNVALVEKLLKKGAKVNTFYNFDRDSNPLYEALNGSDNDNKRKVFDMLIEYGADIHMNIGGDYYVMSAVGYKGTYYLEYLLKNGLSAKSKYRTGYTAVMSAAAHLNLDALKLLDKYKADFKAADDDGKNALMHAVKTLSKIDSDKNKYNLEIIDFLLSKSIKINSADDCKVTALHLACEGDNKDLVRKLLNKGADINARDENFYPPLYYALENVGMVNLLIESGADTNLDIAGKPLYKVCENYASSSGDENRKQSASIILSHSNGKNVSLVGLCALGRFEEAKKKLKSGKCDVNEIDDSKCTALFYVAGTSEVELAKMLIEKGADVNVYGNLIYPLLWKAAIANQYDMVRLLTANGAKLNLVLDTSYGYKSLLTYLCDSYYTQKTDYLKMIKILVESGENVNLPNGYSSSDLSCTPFIKSLDHAPLEVVSYLFSKGGDLFATVRRTRYRVTNYGCVDTSDLRDDIKKFVENEIKKMFLGKKKIASENLKMRKSYDLYSDVVDVIGKNNSVEIIEVGKMDVIDDISSVWVKVKVVPGAKNSSGKIMDPSVTGWCFAGYLK